MKKHIGYHALLITLCISAVSCNKAADEYFEKQTVIVGLDAQCSSAADEAACLETPSCQPAYEEPVEGQDRGEYYACILNPDDGVESGGASGGEESSGSSGGGEESSGSSGGEESGGSASGGSASGGSASGGSASGGSASGGSASGGSSSGGSASGGSASGGSTGGGDVDDDVKDVVKSGSCKGFDLKDLLIKKEIEKKDGSVKIVAKAKVCHHSKSDAHAIIIACPAVKAHVKNHGDYLGSCKVEE
jgi:hypothetical protein